MTRVTEMKGKLHEERMYIFLCPSSLLFQYLAFFCLVYSHGEWLIPFQHHDLYFIKMELGFLQRKILSEEKLFSSDWFSLNFIWEPCDFLLLGDVRRLGLHLVTLSSICSIMSLVCWSVVDMTPILCNLGIILYKTTQDFGALWNKSLTILTFSFLPYGLRNIYWYGSTDLQQISLLVWASKLLMNLADVSVV